MKPTSGCAWSSYAQIHLLSGYESLKAKMVFISSSKLCYKIYVSMCLNIGANQHLMNSISNSTVCYKS